VPDQPLDEDNVVPSRFQIGDVEAMVKVAIDDANAGHNVYARPARCAPSSAASGAAD
jgi:hypothetical protein